MQERGKMLKEILPIKISAKDEISRMIYNYYNQKCGLGVIALIESIAIASLQLNIKPLSILVISPSGQMKSSLTQEIYRTFPENTINIDSRFTPYGLSK